MMKTFVTICLVAMMVSTASANSNSISGGIAPAPVLDTGWWYDQVNAAFVDSVDSPYVFTLTNPAYFRISDDFVPGDIYYVYDSGLLILTTVIPYAGVPTGLPTNYPGYDADLAWQNPAYSGGEILLAAGAYSLTVQGNGAGGIPAGLWTQLTTTTIPAPGAILLGSIGVSLVGWLRRRRSL